MSPSSPPTVTWTPLITHRRPALHYSQERKQKAQCQERRDRKEILNSSPDLYGRTASATLTRSDLVRSWTAILNSLCALHHHQQQEQQCCESPHVCSWHFYHCFHFCLAPVELSHSPAYQPEKSTLVSKLGSSGHGSSTKTVLRGVTDRLFIKATMIITATLKAGFPI